MMSWCRYVVTNISEEPSASTFGIPLPLQTLNLEEGRTFEKFLPINQTKLNGVTSHKTVILTLSALITSSFRLDYSFLLAVWKFTVSTAAHSSQVRLGFVSIPKRPDRFWRLPASYPICAGPEVKRPARQVDRLHPMPRLRICSAVTVLQIYTFMAWTETTLRFTITGCLYNNHRPMVMSNL